MGWDHVGKGEGGDALPVLQVEAGKTYRIRLLGENAVPALSGTKYAEPEQRYQHWPPKEMSELVGGRPVACIKISNGCIFHSLDWRTQKSNLINCIWYEGYKPGKKGAPGEYEARKIVVFQGGVQIFAQMRDQARTVDLEPDQVDWIVSKTGTGMQTAWTATMIPTTLDGAEVDLAEFPEQGNYADEEMPQFIDFDLFESNRQMTAAEQTEWYNKQLEAGEETPEDAADKTTPPAAPPGAPTPAGKPAPGRITMPGKAKTDPPAPAAPAPATPPPAPKAATAPPPPPAAAPVTVPNPAHAAWKNATKINDPWGTPLKSSEHIDFIIETGLSEEFQITEEILAAAQLVKAGEPEKTITSAAPASPKRGPGRPPGPGKATPPPAPAPAAATEDDDDDSDAVDVSELRDKLLTLTKSSEYFKSLKNMKKFLAGPAGGVKSIGAIEDAELLSDLIELVESGDEAVAERCE